MSKSHYIHDQPLGLGLTAAVLGVVGLLLFFLPILSIPLGGVGLVFGFGGLVYRAVQRLGESPLVRCGNRTVGPGFGSQPRDCAGSRGLSARSGRSSPVAARVGTAVRPAARPPREAVRRDIAAVDESPSLLAMTR